MNNYPYPVLTEFDSGYKEKISFFIEKINTINEKDGIVFKIDYRLTSKSIQKKIDNNQAALFIKIETKIMSKMERVESRTIKVNYEDIAESDRINISLYILALENCSIVTNNELLDIYGEDYDYQLRKNDVIAISNIETFYYNLSGNDFIKIIPNPKQDGCGFRINCDKTNCIQVVVGKNFNIAYGKIKGNISIRDIFNSHLVFEIFVYILIEIAKNKNTYEKKDWYQSFAQIMDSCGKEIDLFVSSAFDGEGINIEYVYKIAQELIDNTIEKSLIRVSEKEGKNES